MSALKIVGAWYGSEKDVEGRDITEIVANYIAEGNTEIMATNYLALGDPQHGVNKTLWISYSVDDGATTKVVAVAENTTIQIAELN